MYNNAIAERKFLESNIISLNDKAKLIFKSLAAKNKMLLMVNIYLSQSNSIINRLDKVSCQVMNVRQILEEIELILNHVTNDFYFDSNMKIEYSKKQLNNPQQEISRAGPSGVSELADGKNEEDKRRHSKFIPNVKTFPSSISNSTRSP